MDDRHWQNWDIGHTAKLIDEYWMSSSFESGHRLAVAREIKRTFGQVPIFEIGCGTGLIANALFSIGHQKDDYCGADVSRSMLSIAGDRFPDVRWTEADVLNLKGQQNNVVCIHVLQHLPHYKDALIQLMRFARQRLFIASWFTLDGRDRILFSEIGLGDQKFYNNAYDLSAVLREILSFRPVQRLEMSHLANEAHAISITFRQSADDEEAVMVTANPVPVSRGQNES
jgi:ubiquinone/menaquinone biosynthesis C-methylase UbiE